MVVIRLARGGAKRRPFYSLVVADSRFKRDGRYIEKVGFYNPVASGKAVPLLVNIARVEYWLSQGAQCSDTVSRLFKEFKNSQVAA